MKKIILILFAGVMITMVGCKKNQIVKNETGEISEENTNIQSGFDGATNDANTAISGNGLMSGRLSSANAAGDVCGATTDTTQRSQGIITLTFDGTTTCNGRIRSGQLKLTLQGYSSGTRWNDQNAVLQVDFIKYKVKRTSDNASLTFNGTGNVKNVSGGNIVLLVLGAQSNIQHLHTASGLVVTFDDGKTSTFNISRMFTHTYANSVYQIKGEGTGSNNGLSNLENWGVTRDGDNFTSQVIDPVIWNSTCGVHKPVSGKLDIKVDSKQVTLTTTLGVDASGNSVTSGCPWGLKVEWTYKNKTGSKNYAYH